MPVDGQAARQEKQRGIRSPRNVHRGGCVLLSRGVYLSNRWGEAHKTLWVYDLRTNKHFTLKTKRMARKDLDEFVKCYRPGNRNRRKATWSEQTPEGRWRSYTYDELFNRDKVSLDLFRLRDESLEDSANLPDPHVLAQEIADDLRSALGQIENVLGDLEQRISSD